MAQNRSRKRSWLKSLLLFIITPLIIWFLAFLIWFFWRDLSRLFDGKNPPKAPAKASRKGEGAEPQRENKPQEKIRDEDRKKLDEVLKTR